jgi:L-ascorbate metabolism protein UlaG (beta-lactamase superfamily)
VLRRIGNIPLVATARDVAAETARMLLRPLGANWRNFADAAKRRQTVLRLADRLGREKGRIRFLDGLNPPPPAPRRPDVPRLLSADLGAAWLGHATLLLRVGGRTILTDPVFSPRVGLGLLFGTIGPKRRQQPALSIDELPPIDLVLSSHAHFDHLDRPSLWRIARRFPNVPVIAAAGTRDLLADLGFGEVRELPWEQGAQVAGLKISAIPVKHWGPRVFYDDWRGYNAYLVESDSHRVLFGGDTAFTDAWSGVGPLDLLAIGISAYDPFVAAHATPEQAWEMAQMAAARHVLPMHHTTFKLSYEPIDEPLQRLMAAAGPDAGRIVARQVGDSWFGP